MNKNRHDENRRDARHPAITSLQPLTTAEMHELCGGARDSSVHCYESPNKVIDEYAVWYEVPCDG